MFVRCMHHHIIYFNPCIVWSYLEGGPCLLGNVMQGKKIRPSQVKQNVVVDAGELIDIRMFWDIQPIHVFFVKMFEGVGGSNRVIINVTQYQNLIVGLAQLLDQLIKDLTIFREGAIKKDPDAGDPHVRIHGSGIFRPSMHIFQDLEEDLFPQVLDPLHHIRTLLEP